MSLNSSYRYHDRDVSWLAFNKRVLEEALDKRVPLFERVNFLSIFSTNIEEFYQVRVAIRRARLLRAKARGDEQEIERGEQALELLTHEVKRQEELFRYAWEEVMVPDLKVAGLVFVTNVEEEISGAMLKAVKRYFREDIYPFLQPVLINPELVHVFVRDHRIYLAVYLSRKSDGAKRVYMIKLPFTKAPRFFMIPTEDDTIVYTFVDEVVRSGLEEIFPGYDVLGAYSFKVSRDADIEIDDYEGGAQLAESIEEMIAKRKIGAVTRFQFDDTMPHAVLTLLVNAIGLREEDLLPCRRHLQLGDLRRLINPLGPDYQEPYQRPIPNMRWELEEHRVDHILHQDDVIYVPYTSFSYLLDLLNESAIDPRVKGIKLTQYRVAEDSGVIDALIKAANSGKKVTVFVELKARFDEENNLQAAQRMTRHGIKIIYSLPKLKVHAKTCYIELHEGAVKGKTGICCFSTGNFNERTAKVYSDVLMFTSRIELAQELSELFRLLEFGSTEYHFQNLLVANYGMVERIHELIDFEMAEAKAGRPSRMILKMNSLEEQGVIDKLYSASEAGVPIDLLIRGICRVISNQSFSKNIRIIRLVDKYLEHARIWYFYHGGEELYYISSADWMGRNLYKRIECAAPVLDESIKFFLKEVLELCLSDNTKACIVDENLNNIPKKDHAETPIRTQEEMYHVVERFNHLPPCPTKPTKGERYSHVVIPHLDRAPKSKQSWLSKMVFGSKK